MFSKDKSQEKWVVVSHMWFTRGQRKVGTNTYFYQDLSLCRPKVILLRLKESTYWTLLNELEIIFILWCHEVFILRELLIIYENDNMTLTNNI